MAWSENAAVRWGMVILTLILFGVGLDLARGDPPQASSDQHDPRLGCSWSLGSVTVAVERFREEHGIYPTSLRQLAPDYLSQIPGCLAADSRGWAPDYAVSRDRQAYGLVCTADHQGRGPVLPGSMPGLVLVMVLDDCVEAMEAEASLVKKDLSRGLHPPSNLEEYDLPEYIGYFQSERGDLPSCKGYHRLVMGADAAFEIVCTSTHHVGFKGLMPLEPRYDSRIGQITRKPLRTLPPQPETPWLARLMLSGLALLLGAGILLHYRQSRARNLANVRASGGVVRHQVGRF